MSSTRRPGRLGNALLAGLVGYGLLMATAGVSLITAPPAQAERPIAVGDIGTIDPDSDPASGPASATPTGAPSPARSLVQAVPDAPLSVKVSSGRPTGRASSARPGGNAPGQQTRFTPVQLVLPGAQAPVIPENVDGDGSLTIPTDPQVVGLWTGGALPGDLQGSVVLAGHVDSAKYGVGVLVVLKSLRPGQIVELRGSAGQVMRYRVTGSRTVPQQSLAKDDKYFRQDVPARLVMITCGGPFDPVRHHYQDNVIVVATPV